MKKIVFSSLILLPSLLFSYQLEFNKQFSKNIKNDKLSTNITVNINSKQEYFINESIEFFQDFIKEDNTVTKKNGKYSLFPNYSYQKNKKIFLDYKGVLRYNIETPNQDKLNQFLSELNRIKNNIDPNKIKLTISNIQWIVSKDLYEKNIDSMRIDAIKWIKEYSKTLDDMCVIKNISLNKDRGYDTPAYARSTMMKDGPTLNITPLKTKENIKLNANYKLECK